MPTARQWRQYDRDHADAAVLRRAATFLRDDPSRGRYAGLDCDEDALVLAALLDIFNQAIRDADPADIAMRTAKSFAVHVESPPVA